MKKLWIVTIETRAVALAETETEACRAVQDNIRDIMDEGQTETYGHVAKTRAEVRGTGYTDNCLPWVWDTSEELTIGEHMDNLALPERT